MSSKIMMVYLLSLDKDYFVELLIDHFLCFFLN